MSATIRPARREDCAAVAEMVRRLAALFGVEAGTTAAVLEAEAFGARPGIGILVAEAEGRLAGYLVHQPTFSTWRGRSGLFIVDLFVEPAARNGGLGGRLLAAAASLAEAQGLAEAGGAGFLRLDLDASNFAGQRFYERLGFRTLDHDRTLVLEGAGLARLRMNGDCGSDV